MIGRGLWGEFVAAQQKTAARKFKEALAMETPLQIVGVIHAYAALLAQNAGYRAIYLSGAGVANASLGLPDLAMTSMNDVLEDVRRITAASDLPLLVDIDTGWGGAFNIARTTREMIRSGAAGVHIEDQIAQKRCGHRPNKAIVPLADMLDRIKAALDAKTDPDFIVMARTDALSVAGFDATIERVQAFAAAGADAIFAEAMTDIEHYRKIAAAVDIPVLANITEFGETPLYSVAELGDAGIRMALYPLSAFRAMNKAAMDVYQTIRQEGGQSRVIDKMQTREELYDFLGYHDYERKLNQMSATAQAR